MKKSKPAIGSKMKKAKEKGKLGSPTLQRVGRGGHGQNAGERSPKGRTKRLTFTEGRLRLTSEKSLPDLKVKRLGWPCGGPMVLALIFSVHFASRQKGQERE